MDNTSSAPISAMNLGTSTPLILKSNATYEEKVLLMEKLLARSEKVAGIAKNIADKSNEAKTLSAPLLPKIKQINKFSQDFIPSMKATLSDVQAIISSLQSYLPSITELKQRLTVEKLRLDEFTTTFDRLKKVEVHHALKEYLLPELPPSEASGTLADWANAPELIQTYNNVSDDMNQMRSLGDWGSSQLDRVVTKHKKLLDEFHTHTDNLTLINSDQNCESTLNDINLLSATVESLKVECLQHFDRLNESFQAKDFLPLPSFLKADESLAVKLSDMAKLNQKINSAKATLENVVSAGENLGSHLKALGRTTIEFANECKNLLDEFRSMDEDIQAYLHTQIGEGGISDLTEAVNAWNKFMVTYDAIYKEIERRRTVIKEQHQIAERYKQELHNLYLQEVATRQRFEDTYMDKAKLPQTWVSLDLLEEAPISYDVVPSRNFTILPDLSNPIAPLSPSLNSPANTNQIIPSGRPNEFLRSVSMPVGVENSMLDSQWSISESMLDSDDDSTVYASAVDQSKVLPATVSALNRFKLDASRRTGSSPAALTKQN